MWTPRGAHTSYSFLASPFMAEGLGCWLTRLWHFANLAHSFCVFLLANKPVHHIDRPIRMYGDGARPNSCLSDRQEDVQGCYSYVHLSFPALRTCRRFLDWCSHIISKNKNFREGGKGRGWWAYKTWVYSKYGVPLQASHPSLPPASGAGSRKSQTSPHTQQVNPCG